MSVLDSVLVDKWNSAAQRPWTVSSRSVTVCSSPLQGQGCRIFSYFLWKGLRWAWGFLVSRRVSSGFIQSQEKRLYSVALDFSFQSLANTFSKNWFVHSFLIYTNTNSNKHVSFLCWQDEQFPSFPTPSTVDGRHKSLQPCPWELTFIPSWRDFDTHLSV